MPSQIACVTASRWTLPEATPLVSTSRRMPSTGGVITRPRGIRTSRPGGRPRPPPPPDPRDVGGGRGGGPRGRLEGGGVDGRRRPAPLQLPVGDGDGRRDGAL